MEFIIKSYEDVLTQLDATQLMQLRDKLNQLTFISIDQLILGSVRREWYSEEYGWRDGTPGSKKSIITSSEIVLCNKADVTDVFTGEDLEPSYNTHFEDWGNVGEHYSFRQISREAFLKDQAMRYQIPFQELYSSHNLSKLLEVYTAWCDKVKDNPFFVTRKEEKIKIPLRQYEVTEEGAIRALKPLQYF